MASRKQFISEKTVASPSSATSSREQSFSEPVASNNIFDFDHERVGVVLYERCSFGGRPAKYLVMARLGTVLFSFMGPQTVPGTLVMTGEDLSGCAVLDDEDWTGSRSIWGRCKSWGIERWWPDCSALLGPLGPVVLSLSNWRPYLEPMPQDNGACAIKASIMAVKGMHCMVYAMFHDPNTFLDAWEAADNWTDEVLRKCSDKGIWKEGKGAVVSKVLDVIKDSFAGMETDSGELVMPLHNYEERKYKERKYELKPELVAKLIDQGPCVGRLWACPWYSYFDATENDDWVYRGCGRSKAARKACKKRYPKTDSHAVVCFAYRYCENGKMHVRVLDNHTDSGPERWVDVEELDAIYSLKVDCLCGSAEHHHDAVKKNWRDP